MEKNSTPQGRNKSIAILAWSAFALVLTTCLTPLCLLQVFLHGGAITTLETTRLVYVSGMALGVVLAFVCLLTMALKRIISANHTAFALSLVGILLGGYGIIGHIDTWDTDFGREESSNRAVCAMRLKAIDTAMYKYAQDHEDKCPPQDTWRQTLVKEGYIHKNDMKCFICPSIGGDPNKDCSYVYREPPFCGYGEVILYDRQNNHSYRVSDSSRSVGRNVCRSAHAIEFVSEEKFQELIRQDNAKRQEMGLPPIPAED